MSLLGLRRFLAPRVDSVARFDRCVHFAPGQIISASTVVVHARVKLLSEYLYIDSHLIGSLRVIPRLGNRTVHLGRGQNITWSANLPRMSPQVNLDACDFTIETTKNWIAKFQERALRVSMALLSVRAGEYVLFRSPQYRH